MSFSHFEWSQYLNTQFHVGFLSFPKLSDPNILPTHPNFKYEQPSAVMPLVILGGSSGIGINRRAKIECDRQTSRLNWQVMRDHPNHGSKILGGLWGGTNYINMPLAVQARSGLFDIATILSENTHIPSRPCLEQCSSGQIQEDCSQRSPFQESAVQRASE